MGFIAHLVTVFLGAFNDNAFKLLITLFCLNYYLQQSHQSLQTIEPFIRGLTGVIFSLPYLLCSTYAGYWADRYSKQKIVIGIKIMELIVMIAGLLAVFMQSIGLMLIILFFMGLHSALFSPSKYGILPEILEERELSEGNGFLILWTNAGVIIGMGVCGLLYRVTKPDVYQVSYFLIGVAVVGVVSSWFVPKVPAAGTSRGWEWNFLKEIYQNMGWMRRDRPIILTMVGLVYFSFLGALFILNIVAYARKLMGLDEFQTSVLLIACSVGIGVGSVLAGRLSDRKIELGLVPMGAVGISIFTLLLGGGAYHMFWVVLVCLFLLGISSGFYYVPISAYIQENSPKDRRGQVLATTNFFSFSAMILGSAAIPLLEGIMGLNPARIFLCVGLLTLAGTIYICSLMPYSFVRLVVWILTHTLYCIKTVGRQHVPQKGGALLVANHISYIDALIILVSLGRPIRFLVHRQIFKIPIFNPLLRLVKAIPIAGNDNPKKIIRSLQEAQKALCDGELVCIFAEGQLTRTGKILRFHKGLERIMRGVEVPIIPVHLDRIWGSIFSFEGGRYFFKVPKIIPYPVTVSFGEALAADTSAFAIRSRVMELGAEAFQYRLQEKMTLAESFWREAHHNPQKFCLADSSGIEYTYSQALIGAVAISTRLKRLCGGETYIGILLPPSVGGVLANIAVGMADKIPVNLNYATSPAAFRSMCEQCHLQYVISTKVFLQKMEMPLTGMTVIYIEELIRSGLLEKFTAFLKCGCFLPMTGEMSHRMIFGSRPRKIEEVASIMFTSGSTGNPKGVMLTHANITSNLQGIYQVFPQHEGDRLLGILPFFHSFGFTATLWFPLLSGIGVIYHGNPLDVRMIGRLVENHHVAILMATPTFLHTYTQRCSAEQFRSLRIVIVGAEKLKEQVASRFREKFGLEPLEGYGCTELSSIVSLSMPDHPLAGGLHKTQKQQSIGLPFPGIAVKVIDQSTGLPLPVGIDGLLCVKGPNVMKGYLHEQAKTAEVIRDGWYLTGDIARMDEDGFLMVTDRLSRFSKIGGEMVPHIQVEETIHKILGTTESICVVTGIPDNCKGEQLVVLYTQAIDISALYKAMQENGLPKPWVPSPDMFRSIDRIPILGTGKLDLPAINRLASQMGRRKSGVH
jgi:acyl-[acyl-carrier-protein]-phospholipid O-acyltransferase/long-chain-fatty-acid--[acyl-carrier-protein] ligase